MKRNFFIFSVLVLLGSLSRLVPHGWNFTAIGAVALVAGLLISNKYLSILAPMAALLISDYFIGFHNTMIYVYGAYAVIAVLGFAFSQNKQLKNILGLSLASSLIFFLISNFGVWAAGTGYAKTAAGLMQCFMMGVPFYRNQFLSDLILTPVLLYSFVYILNLNFLSNKKIA